MSSGIAGHYPHFPLTPGVLLCEAAMQAGAVLLAKVVADNPDSVPVVSRMNNVKFKTMVRPGDTMTLEVELTEQMAGAFFLNAKVTVGDKTAVTFDFACKMAPTLSYEEFTTETQRTRRRTLMTLIIANRQIRSIAMNALVSISED